jgi:hypothetical protein
MNCSAWGDAFGGTPKAAVETTALPNPTASFRLYLKPGGHRADIEAEKSERMF